MGTQDVQRKAFRVEQMTGGRDSSVALPSVEESHLAPDTASSIERELATIRDSIARNTRDLSALINEGDDRRMSRAAGELGVAIESMETATQKILSSVEAIDDCARALASALANEYHHGLAQDVQDHVVRIYEACNFQDLAGQRIGKVIATLVMVEEQLAAMVERSGGNEGEQPAAAVAPSPPDNFVSGPRLDGDTGHATQHEIDVIFA